MATTTPAQQKPVHSLILDTGPLIKNTISISTLINAAEELYTTPAILSEVRDEATRSRVQTTLVPFLKIRTPSPASYDAVITFSKKTGDFPVLSRQDLGILALAYEVHCEKHGGPEGLRDAPKPAKKRKIADKAPQEAGEQEQGDGQTEPIEATETPAEDDGWEQPTGKRATKRKAAKPMKFKYEVVEEATPVETSTNEDAEPNLPGETSEEQGGVALTSDQFKEQESSPPHTTINQNEKSEEKPLEISSQAVSLEQEATPEASADPSDAAVEPEAALEQDLSNLAISQEPTPPATDSSASDSDSDGDWITPSNLEAHQIADSNPLQASTKTSKPQQISSAAMTTDFAMQNVLLQMNLMLLSPTLQRIKHVVTKVLRCHACFHIERDMSRAFCPRCGQATLHKVSCSTTSKGEFRIHLARNYTHNKRGDKYSIPKPIAGTANGKWNGQGGGKGGWGRDLILTADQKEYQKAMDEGKRGKTRDLMDEDYLPGILTGDRGRNGGRVKVGAGKNVNSKKRF